MPVCILCSRPLELVPPSCFCVVPYLCLSWSLLVSPGLSWSLLVSPGLSWPLLVSLVLALIRIDILTVIL